LQFDHEINREDFDLSLTRAVRRLHNTLDLGRRRGEDMETVRRTDLSFTAKLLQEAPESAVAFSNIADVKLWKKQPRRGSEG
jgi:hypothetical protein